MPVKKLTKASGIVVHCSYSVLAKIGELKEHPRNPNRHSDDQIKLLAKLIKIHGWRSPITVSDLSGCVIRGHGRFAAARFLQLATVPVDVQHYETESRELADLVADNEIATYAKLDETVLKQVLTDLSAIGEIDMELTGIKMDDIDALLSIPPQSVTGPPDMELQPNEHYDYVVFMFKDDLAWKQACQRLGLVEVKTSPYSTTKIGLGRVLNGERLLALLGKK